MRILKRSCNLLVPLIAIAVLVGWPVAVLADADPVVGTKLLLSAPASAPIGQPVRLAAMLRDDSGQPIGKATVRFYSPVTFLAGASGLELLDEATTDVQGVATIEYVPTTTETMHIVAKFDGDSQHAPSQADTTVPLTGDNQLYHAEAGIRVPFVSKWILVGVLSFVWGTYFLVVNLILRIASTSD